MTIRQFVCSHNPDDGRPPTTIEVYRHGQGNAGRTRQRAAREIRRGVPDGVSEAIKRPLPTAREGESRNDYLQRVIEHGDAAISEIERLRLSLAIQNHHQIECPDCGYSERVSAKDIETVMEWGTEQGLTAVPLRSLRRILALIDRE